MKYGVYYKDSRGQGFLAFPSWRMAQVFMRDRIDRDKALGDPTGCCHRPFFRIFKGAEYDYKVIHGRLEVSIGDEIE